MKLSKIKELLPSLSHVEFQLEDGTPVPKHFHITEVGGMDKHFIDCGGVVRKEYKVNFQLWNAEDTSHRLMPTKLLKIIELSEDKLGLKDGEIEVEYQRDTIGKFDLAFTGETFVLVCKQTACLASDACGIPQEKTKLKLSDLQSSPVCTPNSGCC